MNRMNWMALPLVGMALLVSASPAQAGINHGSSFGINPNGTSGFGNGWAYASNYVATEIGSNYSVYLNPEEGTAMLYGSIWISLTEVDPGASSPFLDFMEDEGMSTGASFDLTNVVWDGEDYHFNSVVSGHVSGFTSIWRDDEHTELSSYTSAYLYVDGAIPVDSWSSFQVFEPGHPSWLPDAQLNINFSCMITTGYELAPVPSPGALALLGLAGLIGQRRRR